MKPVRKKISKRKRLWQVEKTIFLLFMFLGLFSYLTNPFTRYSVVRDPSVIRTDGGEIITQSAGTLYVIDNPVVRLLATFKTGWHMLANRVSGGGKGSQSLTVDGIIT